MSLHSTPSHPSLFCRVPRVIPGDHRARPRLFSLAAALFISLLFTPRSSASESLRETFSLAGGWKGIGVFRDAELPGANWLETIPPRANSLNWPGPLTLSIADHPDSVTVYLWRPVETPRRWRGRAAWLQIPEVEGPSQVFLNGRMVGRGELAGGAGTDAGVSAILLPGESNLLVLKIRGGVEARRMLRGDPPALVIASPLHLSHVVVRPAHEEGIFHVNAGLRQFPGVGTATARSEAESDRYDVEFLVRDGPPEKPGRAYPDSAVRSIRLHDRQMNVSAPLPIPDHRLWTPDAPVLYTIEIALRRNDKIVDRMTCAAGFASTAIEEGRLHRNGRWMDLYAFGIPAAMVRWVEEGAWTEAQPSQTDASAPATSQLHQYVHARRVAFWRNAALALKSMGFNLLRFDDRATPAILDAADRAGIFVEQRIAPQTRGSAPDAGLAAAHVIADAVRRDQTHPSLVFWRIEAAGSAAQMNALANALSILDPARPAFAFLREDTRIRRPGIVYVPDEKAPLAVLETGELSPDLPPLRAWELLSVSMDPDHPLPLTPSWTWIPLLGELRADTASLLAERIRMARANPQSAGCGLAIALPEWGRAGMPPAQRVPSLPEFLWPFQDRTTSDTIASALTTSYLIVNPTLDTLTIGVNAQVDVAVILPPGESVPERGILRLRLLPAANRATAFPPGRIERTLDLSDYLDTTRVARIGIEINITPDIPPGPALLEAEWDAGGVVEKSRPHPVVVIKRN